MNFAVLGDDKEALQIAEAIRSSTAHRVTCLCDAGEAIRALAPSAQLIDSWEDLLSQPKLDAIIVAGGPQDLRSEQLRRIAQSEFPALVTGRACGLMLLMIELEMMLESESVILEPWMPDRLHPAIHELIAAKSEGPIGHFQSAKIDRFGAEKGDDILRRFVHDADLLQSAIDRPARILAVSATGAFENLTVHMHDTSNRDMQWSFTPAESARAVLKIVGEKGRAVLSMQESAPWELTWTTGKHSDKRVFEAENLAVEALNAFVNRVENKSPSLWPVATRLSELVDALHVSLKKRRMIDLHWEEHSEANNFKGIMAASGCLILMVSFLLIVVVGVLGAFNPFLLKIWPALLLGLLGAFLLLQLLQLAYPANRK